MCYAYCLNCDGCGKQITVHEVSTLSEAAKRAGDIPRMSADGLRELAAQRGWKTHPSPRADFMFDNDDLDFCPDCPLPG